MKQSGPLRRTVALARRTGLKRTSALARTGTLRRTAALARSGLASGAHSSPKRRKRTAATVDRAAILERDGGCVAARLLPEVPCWGGLHLHHRLRRSQGGSDAPENLVTLCAAHHGWVHEHPEKARLAGLLQKSSDNPC